MAEPMLFLFGVVVAALLAGGVGFTAAEFRAMARAGAPGDDRDLRQRKVG